MPSKKSKAPSKPSKNPAKRPGPLKSIRLFVLDHNGGQAEYVRLGDVPPTLRPYRFGRNPTEEEKLEYGPESKRGVILPVLSAIREWCIDCSGGSAKEVRTCPITDCPLHHLRLGKNPARSGVGPKAGCVAS